MEKEQDEKNLTELRQLEEAGLSKQEISVILRHRNRLSGRHAVIAKRDVGLMMILALAGALSVRILLLFKDSLTEATTLRFLISAVCTPVSLYLCSTLKVSLRKTILLTTSLIVLPLISSWYPVTEPSHTAMLAAVHLPFLILFFMLITYFRYLTPGTTRVEGINEGLVFAGETVALGVLAMIGWLALTGIFSMVMDLFGLDSDPVIETWLIPSGFSALVTVSAFVSLIRYHDGQTVVTSLATIFVPLVDLLLLALIAARLLTAGHGAPDRELLILIDIILILVICLVLVSPVRRKGTVFFYLELILIASALILDITALISITSRLIASGVTPHKSAGLGLNILIFTHLLYLGKAYLVNADDRQILLRAKTGFLPLYALWCAVVVYLFPFFFSFR